MSEPRILEIERRLNTLAADVRALGKRVAALEQRGIGTAASGGGGSSSGSTQVSIRILTPVGGVPARVGLTDGYATCKVYQRIDAIGNLADTGSTALVFNTSSAAVGAAKMGVALVDGDAFVIVVESCA